MSNARELAEKIRQGLVEADYNFHGSIALWNRITYAINGIAFLLLVVALATTQFIWTVVGFILIMANLVIMINVQKFLNAHECILPAPKDNNAK
jgi:hypothetical protein